jgi:RecA-family ATPase
MHVDSQKFELQFIPPFSTFHEGTPAHTPFVIDGLLTQGGFSILAAKPKVGKSSLSRHEAVAISQGATFLGRETAQGEAILISLEDQRGHTDNCLQALGYDPTQVPRFQLQKS